MEFLEGPLYDQNQGYGKQIYPSIIKAPNSIFFPDSHVVTLTRENRPPDTEALAWFACLCCFCPTGLVALMFACQADVESNDTEAWRKYRIARRLIFCSIICGLILISLGTWRLVYIYWQ